MKMTRQHFQLIADILRENERLGLSPSELAIRFASELAKTNDNFDRERFLAASRQYDPESYTAAKGF